MSATLQALLLLTSPALINTASDQQSDRWTLVWCVAVSVLTGFLCNRTDQQCHSLGVCPFSLLGCPPPPDSANEQTQRLLGHSVAEYLSSAFVYRILNCACLCCTTPHVQCLVSANNVCCKLCVTEVYEM